jgi:hypothetical protein
MFLRLPYFGNKARKRIGEVCLCTLERATKSFTLRLLYFQRNATNNDQFACWDHRSLDVIAGTEFQTMPEIEILCYG